MEYYIEPETFSWSHNGQHVYFACSVNNWEPIEMKKKDGKFVHEMIFQGHHMKKITGVLQLLVYLFSMYFYFLIPI